MPGKNQTKRKNKSIQHARLVWTRKAIAAANSWSAVKDAAALIEQNREELQDVDMQLINDQVELQKHRIHEYLVAATEHLVKEVGKELGDQIVKSFVPEGASLPVMES